MTYNITDIQGIGPEFHEKFKLANVHTTDDFLKVTADDTSMRKFCETTGLSENLVVKWTKMARLMNVKGVGPQYAELLYASGVESVEKLREQRPEDLLRRLGEVNATKKLTAALPQLSDIVKWKEHVSTTPQPVR